MSKLAEELDALALKSLYSGNQPSEKERIALIDEKLSGVRLVSECMFNIVKLTSREDLESYESVYESVKVD